MQRLRAAFTLVELSIVLVILGLLVGGVLAGQSLIRAAELRAVSREYEQYVTALNTFKDKYFALPGDMPNAVKYWGAQAGSATADGKDATCAALTTAATSSATCNGDGNGVIGTISATDMYESYRAWQHLANAGLVAGSFSGIVGPSGGRHGVIGVNLPRSKIAVAGWTWRGFGTYAGDADTYGDVYGTVLGFGATISGDWPYAPALKAEEAYAIDKKIDDGKPGTGKVMTWKNHLYADCVASGDADYSLSTTIIACPLIFKTGF